MSDGNNPAVHPIEHFCCQNPECADRGERGHGNLRFRGFGGRDETIRMIHCRTCGKRFSERRGTAFEQSHIPGEKAVAVLAHLREGCGTRKTARLVGVHRDTVTRLARVAGAQATKLHDELVASSPPHARGSARREVDVRR
ncbi:MAG: transposase [Polyangiaceae bacterium]